MSEDPTPCIGARLSASGDQVKKKIKHRLNRRCQVKHRCIQHTMFQRRCQVSRSQIFSTNLTDGASDHSVGAMMLAEEGGPTASLVAVCDRLTDALSIGLTDGPWSRCNCVREANSYFRAQSDRKNRCPSTGNSDAYAEICPMAPNG